MGEQVLQARDVETDMGFGIPGKSPDLSPVDPRWPEYIEQRRIRITDARPIAGRLSLDREGIELHAHPVTLDDYFDQDAVANVLVPPTLDLIARLSGTPEVFLLETVVRAEPGLKRQRADLAANRVLSYAARAHLDGDETMFRDWAAHLLPATYPARYAAAPFAVYNIWKPIRRVENNPLAFCSAVSFTDADLVDAFSTGLDQSLTQDEYLPEQIRYFHLAHAPGQQWYYFADMLPEEAVVFKQWDSRPDHAGRVAHGAFVDPASKPGSPPRQSVELRVIAFFPTSATDTS